MGRRDCAGLDFRLLVTCSRGAMNDTGEGKIPYAICAPAPPDIGLPSHSFRHLSSLIASFFYRALYPIWSMVTWPPRPKLTGPLRLGIQSRVVRTFAWLRSPVPQRDFRVGFGESTGIRSTTDLIFYVATRTDSSRSLKRRRRLSLTQCAIYFPRKYRNHCIVMSSTQWNRPTGIRFSVLTKRSSLWRAISRSLRREQSGIIWLGLD